MPDTEIKTFCRGGPLGGDAYAPEIIRAALAHGYCYRLATDEGERVMVYQGYRKPVPSTRAFLPLRPKLLGRWRVTVQR